MAGPPRGLGAIDALLIAAGVVAAAVLPSEGDWLSRTCAIVWWPIVVVILRSDLDRFIIPDGATIATAVLGGVLAFCEPLSLGYGWDEAGQELLSALRVGTSGFLLFWLVGKAYSGTSGRHGLGFGDVKLAGALGIWLPPVDAALALELAALAGLGLLLWRRHRSGERDTALPFGAFLAPAAWSAFVGGPMLHGIFNPWA